MSDKDEEIKKLKKEIQELEKQKIIEELEEQMESLVVEKKEPKNKQEGLYRKATLYDFFATLFIISSVIFTDLGFLGGLILGSLAGICVWIINKITKDVVIKILILKVTGIPSLLVFRVMRPYIFPTNAEKTTQLNECLLTSYNNQISDWNFYCTLDGTSPKQAGDNPDTNCRLPIDRANQLKLDYENAKRECNNLYNY